MIKKYPYLALLWLTVGLLLGACEKDTQSPAQDPLVSEIYIVNYGTFGGTKSELSAYSEANKTMHADAYKAANGVAYNANIQSVTLHQGKAYLVANSGDKIDRVQASDLKALGNPLSGSQLVNPRYLVVSGNYAYVSCWGAVSDWAKMPESYIAKIDLASFSVVKTIAVPGGLEGLLVAEGKLFAAQYATNRVAVLDLDTEALRYIGTHAAAQHLVADAQGQLWVSVSSTYSAPFAADKLGLQRIDPKKETVTGFVNYTGIAGTGNLQLSNDKKTVYVLGAEPWPGTQSHVYAVDTQAASLAASALISDQSINAFGVNPVSGKIYVLLAPSVTENGQLKVFSASGQLEDTQTTGVFPQQVVFNLQ